MSYYHTDCTIGCDPEFFFMRKRKIVEAETVIGKNGLSWNTKDKEFKTKHGRYITDGVYESNIIVDGVQAELNPSPSSCRAFLGNAISVCFRTLDRELGISKNNDLKCVMKQVIKLSKKDLDNLSEQAKVFGCAPSMNAYTKQENSITVNAADYNFRSAGGHIHLGNHPNEYGKHSRERFEEGDRIIEMMDILVGNTCVLLDRDPFAAKRREVYGRAGDYRKPPWGIEYRTLSNFWLKEYRLMSMVTGLCREALTIVRRNLDKDFLEVVERKHIEDAINTNDYYLALYNFNKIIPVIKKHIDSYETLSAGNYEKFNHFISRGINYWFKKDPFKHWITMEEGHKMGFETFLDTIVIEDMKIQNNKNMKKQNTKTTHKKAA